MLPSAENRQHRPSVFSIGRFSENSAVAFRHRVAAKHQSSGNSSGNIGGLLMR
jgi:hypothetical protein